MSVISGRIHFFFFSTVMAQAYSARGPLTHRAPSECRRSSLHLPPSACHILAPDRTPQKTVLSPGKDTHKGIIRKVVSVTALNASPLCKKQYVWIYYVNLYQMIKNSECKQRLGGFIFSKPMRAMVAAALLWVNCCRRISQSTLSSRRYRIHCCFIYDSLNYVEKFTHKRFKYKKNVLKCQCQCPDLSHLTESSKQWE